MLEVAGLHHEFQIRQGWRRRPLVAVKDVSFRLARGRTVAVVGESGSGKSTLGRCVVRLVQPTRGQVRLDSVELLGLSPAAFRPFQRQLQMVFQDPGEALNPRLTVGEALDEPLRFWQGMARPQRQERTLHLLAQVQLDRSHATRYPHQLSGGQQQRVGIARALAADPQLIVLDEPTSALDVSVQAQILNLLVDLQAETQIAYLLISHDLWTVRYLAQEVIVLYLGQVMERGPVAEVFARPQHPYTRALLSMAPQLHGSTKVAALTLALAIPIGAWSARHQYSPFDYVITAFTFAGQSAPVFWLGLLLILVFYLWLDNPWTGQPLFPVGGMYSVGGQKTLLDLLWHLVLPVTTLCAVWVAWYSRFFRASMLEVLNADYIRTARSKGLREGTVTYVHALRNGIMPLVTMIALDFPSMFAGALFVETIFAWPGMGRLFWDAARGRDYPVLLGVILINAGLIVLCNIIADLIYGWLDPRVRYE